MHFKPYFKMVWKYTCPLYERCVRWGVGDARAAWLPYSAEQGGHTTLQHKPTHTHIMQGNDYTGIITECGG